MARIAQVYKQHLGRDILILAASISCAFFIAENDLITRLVREGGGFAPIQALITGFFLTSLLTITPAGVAFAELASFASPFHLALWGALGALLGDLVLFLLVRDVISEDMIALLRGSWVRKLTALFKSPFLAWSVPLLGALVIASPLPDEVGIALLGLSKSDLRFLIPISYAMNFLGIYLLCSAVIAS